MALKDVYLGLWVKVKKAKDKVTSLIGCEKDVISYRNLPYGDDLIHHRFDVHYPKNMQGKVPAIFNIHGGGYVAGEKEGNTAFCQELAKRGFAVFNVEYTPSGRHGKYFPTPIYEFFEFYNFVVEGTDLFDNIDFNNMFICGNSAGGHIASLIANIQSNPILKREFNLTGGPPIKGSILICPTLGVYNFNGWFPKKEFHEVVFGPDSDKTPIAELTHGLKVTTDAFPPSIMFSVSNDFVVGAHRKPFLKMAKQLGISVQHYDVTEGYKLFHCSLIDHPEKYPICLDKIANFINDAKENIFVKGVKCAQIQEEVPKNSHNRKESSVM